MQVRGKDIPKPVKNWNQCGISSRVLDVLKKGGLTAPMPIQVRRVPIACAATRDDCPARPIAGLYGAPLFCITQ